MSDDFGCLVCPTCGRTPGVWGEKIPDLGPDAIRRVRAWIGCDEVCPKPRRTEAIECDADTQPRYILGRLASEWNLFHGRRVAMVVNVSPMASATELATLAASLVLSRKQRAGAARPVAKPTPTPPPLDPASQPTRQLRRKAEREAAKAAKSRRSTRNPVCEPGPGLQASGAPSPTAATRSGRAVGEGYV